VSVTLAVYRFPRPMLFLGGRDTCALVASKKRHGASAISPA
jgi:hypothetical protein